MRTFYRRRLPHLQPIGGIFFVTFRLADSIPHAQVRQLQKAYAEGRQRLTGLDAQLYQKHLYEEEKRHFKRYDDILDHFGHGNCMLHKPECAQIVTRELHRWNGVLYVLRAYCIMPSHAHIYAV